MQQDSTKQEAWQGSGILPMLRQPAALQPGLYVVATPIGNLEDITLRALRVLRDADFILAEDTRHSRKLLNYFGISTQLQSFHAHNEHQRQKQVLKQLAGGAAIALISDAGMPAVSDPGALIISAAAQAGHPVVPVPGPSAALAGLVASGLSTEAFLFVGFLPAKPGQRRRRLEGVLSEAATLVFYVPPHSLSQVLSDMSSVLGPSRRCVVAREMTKVHEEFLRGTLGGLSSNPALLRCKGEVTVVVEGKDKEAMSAAMDELEHELDELMRQGVSPSQAAKIVATAHQLPRGQIYSMALERGKQQS